MNDNASKIDEFYNKVIQGFHELRKIVCRYVYLPTDGISEQHNELSDVILFIILLRLDIAISCKYFLINKQIKDIYAASYFARALSVHCSDITNTDEEGRILNRIRRIASLYKEQETYKTLSAKLFSNRSKLYSIGRENIQFIESIRNNLFAHRDGTGIQQHDSIIYVELDRLANIVISIDEILNEMIGDLISIQQLLVSKVNVT